VEDKNRSHPLDLGAWINIRWIQVSTWDFNPFYLQEVRTHRSPKVDQDCPSSRGTGGEISESLEEITSVKRRLGEAKTLEG
jgi:hypothetical protein